MSKVPICQRPKKTMSKTELIHTWMTRFHWFLFLSILKALAAAINGNSVSQAIHLFNSPYTASFSLGHWETYSMLEKHLNFKLIDITTLSSQYWRGIQQNGLTILTRLRAFCPEPAESLFFHKWCSSFPTFLTIRLYLIEVTSKSKSWGWKETQKARTEKEKKEAHLSAVMKLVSGCAACLWTQLTMVALNVNLLW